MARTSGNPRMRSRRVALKQVLAGAAASLLGAQARAFNKAAFEAKSVQDTVKALGGTSLAASKDVSIDGPELSENGASVLVTLATTLPGIRQLALLVEKNPNTLAAVFEPNDAVEANFSLRIKMAESSQVYAVAIAQDGKAWFARREIKVTLGGCG